MTERSQPALAQAPEWMIAEMPPGYQTRLWEIERMSAELRAMDRIGSVLWETGEPLRNTVCAVFGAFKCEMDATAGSAGPTVVKLGDSRRLLIVVSGTGSPIRKTDEELAQAFRAVQFASADDRVVLVVNNDPQTAPADRLDPALPDALSVVQRMNVNLVTTATLFRLWRLWYEDQPNAQKALNRLHGQDGGLFVIAPR
jgi:hypothetical protein